jgi:hypothetical protein
MAATCSDGFTLRPRWPAPVAPSSSGAGYFREYHDVPVPLTLRPTGLGSGIDKDRPDNDSGVLVSKNHQLPFQLRANACLAASRVGSKP